MFGVFSVDSVGDITPITNTANDTSLFAAPYGTYTRALVSPWQKVAGVRYALGVLVISGAATPTLLATAQFVAGNQHGILAVPPALGGLVPALAAWPTGKVSPIGTTYGLFAFRMHT